MQPRAKSFSKQFLKMADKLDPLPTVTKKHYENRALRLIELNSTQF